MMAMLYSTLSQTNIINEDDDFSQHFLNISVGSGTAESSAVGRQN